MPEPELSQIVKELEQAYLLRGWILEGLIRTTVHTQPLFQFKDDHPGFYVCEATTSKNENHWCWRASFECRPASDEFIVRTRWGEEPIYL